MKRVFSVIGWVAFCAIFLPLLAALLFAMPVEFAVATWHNLRVDSSTKGTITHSEITRGRGSSEGSSISCSYTVEGALFESSKWRAGLISNLSREEGGGDFAKKHPEGASVDVYYDSSDPGFSLLEQGWPKWSLGFSMAVWGMLISCYFKRSDRKTPRLFVAYPVSRALTIAGFLTIAIFPATLNRAALMIILIAFWVIVLCSLIWLFFGRVTQKSTTANESKEGDG